MPCLIVGFSFSSPFFALFEGLLALLPYHSIIPAVLLFDSCLLGFFWASCMLSLCLISVAQYYHWASIHTFLGFLGLFHCFQASLAHFILFRHPRPISILYSHGHLLSLLGSPGPNFHILYFWGLEAFPPTPYSLNSLLRASLAHPRLLSISHNTHEITTFFSGLLWVCLLSLRPICYFLGL